MFGRLLRGGLDCDKLLFGQEGVVAWSQQKHHCSGEQILSFDTKNRLRKMWRRAENCRQAVNESDTTFGCLAALRETKR